MSDDSARRAILERRARFVAAALAGIGVAAGCDKPPPPESPPTTTTTTASASKTAEPMPCLSQPMPCLAPQPWVEPDAGSPTATDAGAGDARVDAKPTPPPKPPPMPCLKMPPPKNSEPD